MERHTHTRRHWEGRCIDLAIISDNLLAEKPVFHVGEDLTSDHLPIIVTFNGGVENRTNTKEIKLYHKMDWEAANQHLMTKLSKFLEANINSKSMLDMAVESLEKELTYIYNKIPTKAIDLDRPALPYAIRTKIKEKRETRQRYMTHREPSQKQKYNKLKNEIQKSIKNHSKEQLESKI